MTASVLVVDDNPINRDLVCTVLGYRGYSTRTAGGGAEALEVMGADRPDLVLTDVVMPQMDGYALVRAIRADSSLRDTRVVFYTANVLTEPDRAEAIDLDVAKIIEKVGDVDALLDAVADALVV